MKLVKLILIPFIIFLTTSSNSSSDSNYEDGNRGQSTLIHYENADTTGLKTQNKVYPTILNISDVPLEAPHKAPLSYLEFFNEDDFGTKVTRISNGPNDYHHYSKNMAWNVDMTKMKIHQSILDGRTYQMLDSLDDGAWKNTRRWSNQYPNFIYSVTGKSSSVGARFQ